MEAPLLYSWLSPFGMFDDVNREPPLTADRCSVIMMVTNCKFLLGTAIETLGSACDSKISHLKKYRISKHCE